MSGITPPKTTPPEWYQVMYNLAAQKAHLALDTRTSPRRFRWRGLWSDEEAPGRRQELLLDAREHARELLRQAILVIVADEGSRVQKDEGARLRVNEKLRTFLVETVEPTAAVLFAGLTRAVDTAIEEGRDRINTREELLEALASREPSPDAVVGYVTRQPILPYRVRYNLACYFADERPDVAWDNFRAALTSAPRLEATVLADWSTRDPSLGALREARGAEFRQFVSLYRLPTFPERAAEGESPEREGPSSEPQTA